MIILEEDLDVSPDIFWYFYQLLPVLEEDQSLYCVSAWNDQVRDMSRRLLFYIKSALKTARSSDGGERVKSYAGKTRGLPRQFFARALLTERLELANFSQFG